MSDDTSFGVSQLILDRTVGKRFVECMTGKGGLEGLVSWMKQLDFVDGIEPMLNRISYHLLFYDTALTKCAKEALKRPEALREDEIATMLGDKCGICGKTFSVFNSPSECECGGKVDSWYSIVIDVFGDLNINPTPEAVMMWVAYDGLAEAYSLAYEAFKIVLFCLVEQRGWESAVQFLDYELKDRLDYSFYYGEPGDTRIASEEREILMFLVRGNLAGVGLDKARELVRLGIETVKFGHLYNQLFCAGADAHYNSKRGDFAKVYNSLNQRIRLATIITRREREKHFPPQVLEPKFRGEFYPCCLLPSDFWRTGKLAKNVVLKPLERGAFPVFTDEDYVALNCFVGPSGSGKTTFMAATAALAVDWAGEYIFNVMGDEKNSFTLACLPLFPCEGRTNEHLKVLESMGVSPHGIPTLNLLFVRKDELEQFRWKDLIHSHPPTVFDRIVEIDQPYRFGFRFLTGAKAVVEGKGAVGNRGVLNILEEQAKRMGYKHVCGVINARNMLRKEKSDYEKETKPDIQIATTLFDKFVSFRPNNKFPSARVMADEMSRLAPVTHAIAGTDTAKSSATVSDAIKMMRGLNTSFDAGTQKFSEINPDAKAEAKNIFFRELPQSGDKSRSQRDIVLDTLELIGGKAERELVASLMERKVFPREDFYWFWWDKHRGSVQVVRPNPPPFMINQPKKTNLEVFKAYEKFSGESVLLDSWEDVPHLRYDADEYRGRLRRYPD